MNIHIAKLSNGITVGGSERAISKKARSCHAHIDVSVPINSERGTKLFVEAKTKGKFNVKK